MYKNRLLNLQNELESLFDRFPSTNIVDTVKSDLEKGYTAENKSVASAATILKANPKETKSVASATAISTAYPTEIKSVASIEVKSIRQEMKGSEQRVVKKAVEAKKSPSAMLERKKTAVKSVNLWLPSADMQANFFLLKLHHMSVACVYLVLLFSVFSSGLGLQCAVAVVLALV
jgi:hypothetical protein